MGEREARGGSGSILWHFEGPLTEGTFLPGLLGRGWQGVVWAMEGGGIHVSGQEVSVLFVVSGDKPFAASVFQIGWQPGPCGVGCWVILVFMFSLVTMEKSE